MSGKRLHIVGIGVSTGALEALSTLLATLRPGCDTAYVVLAHLSPDHASHLPDLLQRACALPVHAISATQELKADQVYVLPPAANVEAIDTHLRLTPLEPVRVQRAPIDHFFRSMAHVHDGAGVAVVLTGRGSDGSRGVRSVRGAGGLVIAQSPVEAEAPGMPRSAIATGMVDLVLRLDQMAEAFGRFCHANPLLTVPGSPAVAAIDADCYQEIRELLRGGTGTDIRHFTAEHLVRRLQRRMKLTGRLTLRAYIQLLRSESNEARALLKDLLLNTDEFFRSEVFERLEEGLVPLLMNSTGERRQSLRVWAVGCSTGEEAYAFAMVLSEYAERHNADIDFQVFATDMARDTVLRARAGVYPEGIAAHLSAARLDRWFHREDHHYRVRRHVHDRVVFAVHHLLKDPPFIRMDLIACRNLLNDFEDGVRHDVLEIFHHALRPNGYLALGPTEALPDNAFFHQVAGQPGLFQRSRATEVPPREPSLVSASNVALLGTDHYYRLVHHRLRERQAPPSLLVNEHDEVVHYGGGVGRYVQMPGGMPTSRVLDLVPGALRIPLRNALEAARSTGVPAATAPVALVPEDSAPAWVSAEVLPSAEGERLAMVMFRDSPQAPANPSEGSASGGTSEPMVPAPAAADTRDGSEELHLANEELQCTNEELRFVMQELEVSKAELLSVNEELAALDHENRERLGELAELTRDLQHLLESTGMPTLFLDAELRITRYTPPLLELFRVRDTDRGRPFSQITSRFQYADLEQLALGALHSRQPMEREVHAHDGRCFLVRALVYRSADGVVDGVVMTFVDITERKKAEMALQEANRRKDEFLATLAHELRNPLAPIRAGLDVLQSARENPASFEQVHRTMTRQTRQLVRIVDDLMDVARVSGGRLRLRREKVNLLEVVADAVSAARPFVDEAGHRLHAELPAAPVFVDGDAARLIQVLVNLLNNASKYTPRGGEIGVRVARDGHEVTITVADSGVGIAPEKLPHVFELFYSDLTEPLQPQQTGLGVGLTLSQTLIDMHGGRLTAASAGKGCGSEFTIRLPLLPSASTGEAAREVGHEAGGTVPRRVLVVDDNIDAADMLALLMQATAGDDVRVAHNGVDALRIAEEFRPHAILLDLGMPGMDGYEVARRLRAEPWGQQSILVALTGWGQEDDKRRTASAGFDHHLVKPADPAALDAALREPARRVRRPG